MVFTACSDQRIAVDDNPMILWYDRPAEIWEEALPVGNGRLGAMVFGKTGREIIQLNEETVWSGEPGNNIKSEVREYLPEIRRLIFEGKHREAQELANKYLPWDTKTNNNGMAYQPVGNLTISYSDTSEVQDYRRELDISQAVSTTRFSRSGIKFSQEVISSLADDVIVVKLSADRPGAISCTLGINSGHSRQKIEVANDFIHLSGITSDLENKKGKIEFSTLVKPKLIGGQLITTDSTLVISDADELTIFVSIGTNFINYQNISADEISKANSILEKAFTQPYEDLKANHVAAFKKYFDRVQLHLGSTDSIQNPTDVRLAQFRDGNDPQLVALYFQFGRYLLISSSQPGGQPANLQGIWNDKINPPWDSKYTVNINAEMNYWPAEVTNLTEMHEPLFDMIRGLSETGQEAANQIYGARGWGLHHNTDLWRISGVVDGSFFGLWPGGGAWLSQHLWQHYLYTGDTVFLRNNYPVLKGASLFYKDILQEEPQNGWLVISPSMSPENGHQEWVSIAAGTTMDNQLAADVFANVIEASQILELDLGYRDSLKAILPKLAPMQVGRWGQLQEWMHDWDRQDDTHRHVSHLYGLFPSNQISPFRTPELFEAAKTSLNARGDESTGWSMGWKVNLWARFLDGNHAYKLITDQLSPSINSTGRPRGGTYPNLFDAHPPFQIDGNFGCTAGVAEMLVQSHDGAIHVLPALPDTWQNGSVNGLKARGGFEIDIDWKDNSEIKVTITSMLGGNCRIRSYSELKGSGLTSANGDNPNPFYQVPTVMKPVVSSEANVVIPELPAVYEYDLETVAGGTYELKTVTE